MPVIGAGLHDGAHAALQHYLGQDVVPQIAQRAAGVGQLFHFHVRRGQDSRGRVGRDCRAARVGRDTRGVVDREEMRENGLCVSLDAW